MKDRVLSGIAILIVFAAALYFGKYAFLALCFFAETFCMMEYFHIVDKNKPKYVKVFIMLIGYTLNLLALYNISLLLPAIPIAFIGIFILNIFVQQYDLESCLYELFGLIYIPFLFTLAMVFVNVPNGMYLLLLAVGIAFATDVFAYLFGIALGKHKLCPKISPKKSIEGSVFGFLFGTGFSMVVGYIYTRYNLFTIPMTHYFFIGALNSILCQYGDLTASLIKRNFGAKDYGNFIPGHGGVLDRVDGMLFCFAGMFFYASIFLGLFV